MYGFSQDEEEGILEIRIEGTMKLSAVPGYAREFRRHVREARLCGRPLRVLIDVSASDLLPANVAEPLSELEQELLTSARDRVAAVTPSALHALQARNIAVSGRTEIFAAESPARRWLRAFTHNPMRRAA